MKRVKLVEEGKQAIRREVNLGWNNRTRRKKRRRRRRRRRRSKEGQLKEIEGRQEKERGIKEGMREGRKMRGK